MTDRAAGLRTGQRGAPADLAFGDDPRVVDSATAPARGRRMDAPPAPLEWADGLVRQRASLMLKTSRGSAPALRAEGGGFTLGLGAGRPAASRTTSSPVSTTERPAHVVDGPVAPYRSRCRACGPGGATGFRPAAVGGDGHRTRPSDGGPASRQRQASAPIAPCTSRRRGGTSPRRPERSSAGGPPRRRTLSARHVADRVATEEAPALGVRTEKDSLHTRRGTVRR